MFRDSQVQKKAIFSDGGISNMKYVNGRLTGPVTFCVETAFYIGLLKKKIKGGIEVTGIRGRRRRKLLMTLTFRHRRFKFKF
jgi:hypothetical protein